MRCTVLSVLIRCAKKAGVELCGRLLRQSASDFVTFNDDATREETLRAGLVNLHQLLRQQFGTFGEPAEAGRGGGGGGVRLADSTVSSSGVYAV